MIGRDLDDRVVEEVDAIEKRRVLLGFLEQIQAIQHQINSYHVRNPSASLGGVEYQNDDNEIIQKFIEVWEDSRSNIVDPPSFIAGNVEIHSLPDSEEVSDHMAEFKSQQHIKNLLENFNDESWTFGMVPIEPLVAIQPSVAIEGHSEVPTSDDKILDLIEYCLPIRKKKYLMTTSHEFQNRLGFEIVSRGPNIDVTEADCERHDENDSITVQFTIKPRTNIINVAHFQGRYILKNGYHRCFQLLKSGVDRVPAFVRSVNSYQETGGANSSMFPQQRVLSQRPPLLSDFMTGAAIDIDSPGHNMLIRIMAETINVRR